MEGGGSCCVQNCRRRSHDHLGRKIPNGLSFHRFPAWSSRRAAWVAAVGRSSVTLDRITASMRVCSRHFRSGKPAHELLQSDPDWVPSLHMGHAEGGSRPAETLAPRTKRTRRREDTTQEPAPGSGADAGSAESAVPPRSEVRRLLQRRTSIAVKPAEPTRGPDADVSFRDFFRKSLEASLEASSWSGSRSQKPAPASGDLQADVNFEVRPVTKTTPPSSSCPSCVRLQRRIEELEKRLFALTATQQDAETPTVFGESPASVDRVSPSSGSVHAHEDAAAWLEPLSPQDLLHDEDEDQESPRSSALSSSSGRFRKRCSFNPAWLKKFWFLRYSKSPDQMWCHVCRVHADTSHQNLPMIKGSGKFKVDNIRRHSCRIYHKESVKRYILQTWPTADLWF